MSPIQRGVAASSGSDFLLLSDTEKHALALDLLNEFGAEHIKENGDEINHSCVLPYGLHANGDQSASASLNWRKLSYNCFVCGGGGLFWFISLCRGEPLGKVRDWAESKTGLGDDEESLNSLLSYLDTLYNPQGNAPPPPIPHFNVAVLDPWKKIHPYLTEVRHVPVANIERHLVGYDEKINRIIFPHFWKGELVGWQKRRLLNDGSPKYQNTPDFPRDRTIYNNDVQCVNTVIVESPMTVVSKSHFAPQYGMIATFGKQVTKKQLALLRDKENVILWFDNDQAGWDATLNVGEYLLNYTDVRVVDSPWIEDGADLDDETALDLLANTVPYSVWRRPAVVKEWSARWQSPSMA